MNSLMPRVPTKSIVEIDEDDDESFDNYIDTSKPIITTTEQYENIPKKITYKQSANTLILKDSLVFKNDQPDWVTYSTRPDLFPSRIQSDLPIAHLDDDQHLSLKETIFSHLHRQPTVHPTSFNARIDRQQSILENLFIANRFIEQLKQRIVRVRKTRLICLKK